MRHLNWTARCAAIILIIAACGLLALTQSYELRQNALSLAARELPFLRKFLTPPHEALAARLAKAGFALGQPALVRVFKEESVLEVWMMRNGAYSLFASYPICKWSGALGPKLREGDRQAPEGFYEVTSRQLLPTSRHHRAFNTGFPNAFDRALGRTGSVLMVHGDCSSIGCYAMTDAGIGEIYAIVEAALAQGQDSVPVHLLPFRMTDENLARHAASPWASFWRNLAEGDAQFQRTRMAGAVFACGGRYAFGAAAAGCEKVEGW